MPKEFLMRGKTASNGTEVLNFGGRAKPGYGFRMTEFTIWPSESIGAADQELTGTVTAATTAEDPENPNFGNDGLIATAMLSTSWNTAYQFTGPVSVVNDLFIITQDLILKVVDSVSGSPKPVNWQCRFVEEKLSAPQEAVANYKQFTISDG